MPLFGRILCLLLCGQLWSAEALFERGQWAGAIILPAQPEPDEWYAAHSLADWCERVTGHRPAVVDEPATGAKPIRVGLSVGKTRASERAGITFPAVDGDLTRQASREGVVYLLGNNPTATRIAVGRFCEQSLGLCFAFPGPRGADWQTLSRVPYPADESFRPAFPWREISGLRNELSHEWAFSVGYGRVPAFSHGLYAAFGKAEYARDPTLFAQIHGVRAKPQGNGYDANPNLAHPGAPEIGARYARAWFHQNPESFGVPMGVNDTLNFDDSVPSEGWYRERPVRTDYVVRYLNAVAQSFWQPAGDLQGERHSIGTLAYMQTLRAPTVKVHPAIFPWVCADRSGYADARFAAQEKANLQAWVASGARRVGAYDYWYGADYTVPRVNFAAQAQSIRAAQQAGIKGWYAELAPLWGFDAPKAWLGAKLLNQPQQDPAALLNVWFTAAYGAGAPAMRQAYQTIEAAWERDARVGGAQQWIRHFRSVTSANVLTAEERARISEALAEAQRQLAGTEPASVRQANQRWRLQQFTDAWALSQAFAQVQAVRTAQPRTARAALAALQNLVATEKAYQALQVRHNIHWGAISLPVNWLAFIPEDPREDFCSRLQGQPELQTAYTQATQADVTGLSALNALWQEQAAEAQGLAMPRQTEALLETWRFQRATNQFSVIHPTDGLLHVTNDYGTLRQTLPISGGQLVKFAVTLRPLPNQPSEVRLALRFTGSGPPVTRAVRCSPTGGCLLLPSPAGATAVEFTIVFENNVHLSSMEAATLPLPR